MPYTRTLIGSFDPRDKTRPQLSLTDSILLLAGGIIGSGIFLTAQDVATSTRRPWLFLSVWGIGMVITLLACFAFAELGAMFPKPADSTFTCARLTVNSSPSSTAG